MVRKLARIPGDKRFTRADVTRSQKKEYEKTNVLKKNLKGKISHFTSQKSNRFQEPRKQRTGMKLPSSIVIEILTNL